MIHPSYVDLMAVVNKNVEEGDTPVINSRYSIVMATAKRARQIVNGDEPLIKVARNDKPLSIAIEELNRGEIRILAEDEIEEEYVDPAAAALTGEEAGTEESAGSEEESAPDDDVIVPDDEEFAAEIMEHTEDIAADEPEMAAGEEQNGPES